MEYEAFPPCRSNYMSPYLLIVLCGLSPIVRRVLPSWAKFCSHEIWSESGPNGIFSGSVLRKDALGPMLCLSHLLLLLNFLAQTLVFFSSAISGILLGLVTHCNSFSLEGFQILGRRPNYFSSEISFSEGLPHSICTFNTPCGIVLSDPGSASQIAGTLASSHALPHQGRRTKVRFG